MNGYRDLTRSSVDSSASILSQAVKGSRAYGCIFAVLVGGAMSFVIFLGNIMGDCDPGPGCHDQDGLNILQDLAIALPIAAVLGAGVWLVASLIRTALRPLVSGWPVSLVLMALTIILAWFAFDPAMEVFFRLTTPAAS